MLNLDAQMPNLALTIFPQTDQLLNSSSSAPDLRVPVGDRLIRSFAAATGWEIGFEESVTSFQERIRLQTTLPTSGTLKIVDMSSTWPAKTPTCHRAKCDQFVAELNKLIQTTLIANQRELANQKSSS